MSGWPKIKPSAEETVFACIDPKPSEDKGNEIRVLRGEPEDLVPLLVSLECSGQAF